MPGTRNPAVNEAVKFLVQRNLYSSREIYNRQISKCLHNIIGGNKCFEEK
jgi:hypothetical protein